MILYFTNDSRQKKKMIETDYVEDLYDEIAAFFEEHRFRPHFLQTICREGRFEIHFESLSEFFFLEEVDELSAKELQEIIEKNKLQVY